MNTLPVISTRRGLLALSPVALFLVLYLVVSIVIGDFYKMPLSVALVIASAWSIVVIGKGTLSERLEIFSRAAGHSNIIYMIWIFILAGAFASVAKETGAITATVDLTLRLLPSNLIIPGLFLASCFISLSIGTSVGTVVALTPLAVEMAQLSSGSTAFFIGVVVGGSFFGDNLSFISDTTIAATRSQGCNMRDKFIANCWIAIPAAIVTLVVYLFMSAHAPEVVVSEPANYWLVMPYILVIATAIAGMNVTIVLLLGIVSSCIVGAALGAAPLDLALYAGDGMLSMGNLIIITLLAAGMLGAIKAAGGIDFLLQTMLKWVKGKRGAQGAIALLTAIVNVCTANNTVTIITVGSIAKELSTRYGVDPRKTASILDTSACIAQALIPYGAQALIAASLANESPVAAWSYLYYPWALAISLILSIIFLFPRSLDRRKPQVTE